MRAGLTSAYQLYDRLMDPTCAHAGVHLQFMSILGEVVIFVI